MNLPAYSKYKQTETRWLGEVPSHWAVGTFSKFGRFEGGSGFPHEYQGVTDEELAFHKVNAFSRATRTGVLESRNDTISRANARTLGATILSAGTLVFAKVGAALLLGRIASLPEPGCIDNNMMAFISGDRVDPRFARYLLSQIRFDVLVNPGAVPSVNEGQMRRLPTGVPPTDEQIIIADFLDRATGKIDALIDKQNQLIATLREDRTATITHAVTKGLNPDAEMKDSGVAWLGSIPSHWSAPQVGMHTAVGNGATPSREEAEYWTGGTVPWLNSSHVNRDEITDADQFVTGKARTECHLPLVPAGSVLVGLTGQGKTRGMASILRTPATINQHLAYLTPAGSSLDPEFLHRVVGSAYQVLRDVSEENGSTKGGLTCAALRKLRIPVPPYYEQRRIVAYLCAATAQIDLLIMKSGQVVSMLREYRSALITAAVTGKIDVREAA